jgi:hypothetical protein
VRAADLAGSGVDVKVCQSVGETLKTYWALRKQAIDELKPGHFTTIKYL